MINPNTLRHHRTLAGLSQRGLAKTAGLGPLGIKRIEDGADAGRLPLAVVLRIAEAINVTVDQLLDTTAEPQCSSASLPEPEPLNYNQAKLLRRIHRGEDVTRRLSKVDRELTLPALVRQDAVRVLARGFELAPAAARSLDRNDPDKR